MLITEQKTAAAAGMASTSEPPTARQAATGYSHTEVASRWIGRSINSNIWGQEETSGSLRTLSFIASKFINQNPPLETFQIGPGKRRLPGPDTAHERHGPSNTSVPLNPCNYWAAVSGHCAQSTLKGPVPPVIKAFASSIRPRLRSAAKRSHCSLVEVNLR